MRCIKCDITLEPYELLSHLVDAHGASISEATYEVRRQARELNINIDEPLNIFMRERPVTVPVEAPPPTTYIPRKFPKKLAEAARLVLFKPPEKF